MRVRSNRHSNETRRRGGAAPRRPLLRRDQAAGPAAEPRIAPEDDDLADERRLRASGGPHDRAQYTCACGYVWEADVSASVSCPHCGASQAW
jgi:hypothetical protein